MLQLIIASTVEQAESIADFLSEQGALAVSMRDAGDQPLFQEAPNETPLWKDTKIQALFDENIELDKIIANLQATFESSLEYHIETLLEENWVEKTQQDFPARCFANKLWVVPSGAVLRINPGLGFGTGAHPTTALCLDWLAQQDLIGKTVIDYGCGSGILGLAALSLGAKKAWAVDHDSQALTATRDNALLNHFSKESLEIVLPMHLPPIQADIILANILANPICELASELIAHLAPNAQLVLSGFLTEEAERITQHYSSVLELVDHTMQENWVRLVFRALPLKEKKEQEQTLLN